MLMLFLSSRRFLNLTLFRRVCDFQTLGLFRSPIWLKFYPCFLGFEFFKSAYTLVGYVTFKKIKSALQGSNFNEKAKIETVPHYKA